jgi:hypothetical protein
VKYRITLKATEREELKKKVSSGAASAREISHAQVLLKIDQGGPRLTDVAAAQALGTSSRTVQRIRQRCFFDGVESALGRAPQPARPKKRKLDDELEVRLIAVACTDPPEGRRRWTLRLLSERMVELKITSEPVSHESIRQALKKTNFVLTESKDG